MTTPSRGSVSARRLGRPPRGWVRKNLHIDQRKLNVARKALGVKTETEAVVMLELRAGAVTDAQAKVLQDGIFGVFERRNRVVGPSAIAFKDCGRILATLFRQDGVRYKDRPRSLLNDILIAITCRENGFTLLTAE